MVKRALTLLTSILIALPLLMPFNIYGATWGNAPIIGLNITMINIDNERVPNGFTVNLDTDQTRWQCVSSHSSMGCQTWVSQTTSDTVTSALDGNITANNVSYHTLLYEYEFVFDKPYVGWIQTDFNSTTTGYTPKTIYVNGISAKFTSNTVYTSFSVTNYSLTYTPLETIEKMKQWNIPIESYPFIQNLINYNNNIVEMGSFNEFNYPIFEMTQGDTVIDFQGQGSKEYYLIFYFSAYFNRSNSSNMFEFGNCSFSSVDLLNERITIGPSGRNGFLYKTKVLINGTESQNVNANIKLKSSNTCYLIPIYFGFSQNNYVSTDFALLYGLSNSFLDDIHIIANGTTASQSAAQSSDSANSQLQTDSNTLFQQENGFKSDMNNAMQNVNTTFRLHDMGTKFVSSAQWVRSQYESLTNNTPFASLITFSLITGLALILLGKVYK